VGTVFCALVAAFVLASPAAAANALPNSSFEGSLAGWKPWNATLAQANDGTDGSGAAKVVATSTSYSVNTSPRPVQNQPAGITYTGNGWVRSDTPGHSVCIYIREWGSSGALGTSRQCVTATTAWQRFPAVSYTTQGGVSLEEYAYSTGTSGNSFEIDGMSLEDGAAPPPPPPSDTTPPETTITSGPAEGSSTTSTSASFTLASSESGTFQCALDGAAWSTCSSSQSYSGLSAATHTFQARATDSAGNVDPTPATRSWTVTAVAPPPPPPPPSGGDPVLLATGDQHGCDAAPGAFGAVADLIAGLDPNGDDTIASLGDASGDLGTAAEYASCFDPKWGRFKSRVRPTIGNHDWTTGNANGYFGYFGAAAGPVGKGWYSYDLGTWHVVVLSSYCGQVGGCGLGSPQVAWLKSDLAAHKTQCTLAYWHHPYYTSSPQPGTSGNTSGFWSVLYANGADVVVNAHVRMYERFAPQNASGTAAANGIREFIVGTGGGALASYSRRAANSEAIDATSYGVLSLTLKPGSYDWQFVPVGGAYGSFRDAGSASCH
jgi:hypothetical protein